MLFHEYQLIKPYCLQYKLFPYIWLNCRRHWRKLIGGRLWLLCNKARFARALERRWLLLICVPRWHYPRSGHQCRLKNPLHYRILNRQWHTDSDGGLTSLPVLKNRNWSTGNSVGSWLHPAVSSWTTLPVYSPKIGRASCRERVSKQV